MYSDEINELEHIADQLKTARNVIKGIIKRAKEVKKNVDGN